MGDEVPYTIRFQEKIMEMYPDTDFLEYAKLVLENEEVLPWVEGKNIVKFIAVRNIVNIVVK